MQHSVLRAVDTHGCGLFAARSYAKGDVILEELPMLEAAETSERSGAWELTRALLKCPELLAWARNEFGCNPQIFAGRGNPHEWGPDDAALCRELAGAEGVPEKEVKRMYAVVVMINLTVSPPESHPPLSYGIYKQLSYVNHSCNPSGSLQLRGPFRRLVARHAIADGQEITMSYVHESMLQILPDLRPYLRQMYGFECKCSVCRARG